MNERHPNYGNTTLESPTKWWGELAGRVFGNVSGADKILSRLGPALHPHFSSSAAYTLYADVKPFLERMHQLRRRLDTGDSDDPMLILGIIANTGPHEGEVLQSLNLSVGNTRRDQRTYRELVALAIREARSGEVPVSPLFDLWSPKHDIDFFATSYELGHEKPGWRMS